MAGRTRYERTYACTCCGAVTDRTKLTVKKVEFREMGSKAKTVKSRVTDWLCPTCLVKDEVWNMKPFDQQEVPAAPLVLPSQPQLPYPSNV